MEYRLYTMTEIDKLIEEGKIVPIKEKSDKPDIFEPGDEIQAQLALIRTAKRNRYIRTTLQKYSITLSWDEERNRPAINIIRVQAKEGEGVNG